MSHLEISIEQTPSIYSLAQRQAYWDQRAAVWTRNSWLAFGYTGFMCLLEAVVAEDIVTLTQVVLNWTILGGMGLLAMCLVMQTRCAMKRQLLCDVTDDGCTMVYRVALSNEPVWKYLNIVNQARRPITEAEVRLCLQYAAGNVDYTERI